MPLKARIPVNHTTNTTLLQLRPCIHGPHATDQFSENKANCNNSSKVRVARARQPSRPSLTPATWAVTEHLYYIIALLLPCTWRFWGDSAQPSRATTTATSQNISFFSIIHSMSPTNFALFNASPLPSQITHGGSRQAPLPPHANRFV